MRRGMDRPVVRRSFSSKMIATTPDRVFAAGEGLVTLVLPLMPGSSVTGDQINELRAHLETESGLASIELVVAHARDGSPTGPRPSRFPWADEIGENVRFVSAEFAKWPDLVRAGIEAASGDHVIVLDPNRNYSPRSAGSVLSRIRAGDFDLAIAVATSEVPNLVEWIRLRPGIKFVSRMMLGTSDMFSGLFAIRRVYWDVFVRDERLPGSNPLIETLRRRDVRHVDVPVTVNERFRGATVGWKELRSVKRILDGRFGNYSRLVQFCMVGASGMVVDLTFYALLQLVFSYTWLAESRSALFGCSWHLACAAALSIGLALIWNFALNRRLTFNDADKGSLLPQFMTYVLSNALAIVLSFSVRLYLPAHVGFFARHRLAAAVVGIVAATGISFSMARWLVFARSPELKRPPRPPMHFPPEPAAVMDQTTGVL